MRSALYTRFVLKKINGQPHARANSSAFTSPNVLFVMSNTGLA